MTLKRILFTAVIALCSLHTQATDYYWYGGTTGFWNNANNWSPVGIPTTGDRAFIPSGICRIPHGYSAHADQLHISAGAELINRRNGYIYLHSGTSTQLIAYGRLQNKGRLFCTPASATGSNIYIGIAGELEQTSTGKLYCYDFTLTSINVNGLLDNNGRIEIHGDDTGHDGIVTFDDGIFENGSSAWTFFYDLTGAAIGTAFNTVNPSSNNGRIFIYGDNMDFGLSIGGAAFYNYNHLQIDGGIQSGIYVSVGKYFWNYDYLNVYNCQGDGILLAGNMVNGSGGKVLVQNCDGLGIKVHSVGSLENLEEIFLLGSFGSNPLQVNNILVNEGYFSVTGTALGSAHQIVNDGTIENQSCGFFRHDGMYQGLSGSVVTNEGYWEAIATGSSTITNGDFENIGVLGNVYGTFDPADIDNYGYLLNPVAGPWCVGEIIPDILEIGSNPNHNIAGWHVDSKYPTEAGAYDEVNNDFKIYSPGAGLSTIYIEFNHNGSCPTRVQIGFEPAIQEGIELCGDGIDNDCDGLIDEAGCLAPVLPDHQDAALQERNMEVTDVAAPLLFPNPASGDVLELQWNEVPSGEVLVEIFQADGRKVWEGSGNRLKTGLSNGMYFVRIQTGDRVYSVQKWIVL